jgi:hypothetical protein
MTVALHSAWHECGTLEETRSAALTVEGRPRTLSGPSPDHGLATALPFLGRVTEDQVATVELRAGCRRWTRVHQEPLPRAVSYHPWSLVAFQTALSTPVYIDGRIRIYILNISLVNRTKVRLLYWGAKITRPRSRLMS